MEQMWNVFSSIGDGPQEGGGNRLGLIQSHLKPCLKFIKAIQFNSANIYGAASWEVLCVLLAVEAFVRPEISAIPLRHQLVATGSTSAQLLPTWLG